MSKKIIQNKPKVTTAPIPTNPAALKKLKISLGIIIGVFAFLLYAQSIFNEYALDDKSVTVENKLVTKGLAGIPELLKTDYWYGWKTALRVPEYRPTSLIMFAVEWQFYPNNPHVGHFINVLLYSITCYLLFLVLCELFRQQNFLIPFVCSLFYAAHPIHTEVVDYIKSRDEILCFLFGILSILFVVRYVSSNSFLTLILAGIFFFLSLISKETGITFLLIIPFLLFVFTESPSRKIFLVTTVLISVSAIYLLIRLHVLKGIQMHVTDSVLNNTLITAPDFLSREATAFYILVRYILLLIVPYFLSFDYNFSQIKIYNFSDPVTWLVITIVLILGVYALIKTPKKSIIAFGILYFFISIAPASNIFLLIGATMAERFMYTPSLGFCIIVTYLLIKYTKNENVKGSFINLSQFFSSNKRLFTFVFIITSLYTVRVIARNTDWKDNATIFLHDVKVSENSASLHFGCASELSKNLAANEQDSTLKQSYFKEAITEYNKAITIFGKYVPSGVNNDYGCALLSVNRYDDAINAFQKEIELHPTYPIVYSNLARCFRLKTDYENEIKTYQYISHLNKDSDTSNFKNIGVAFFNWGNLMNSKQQYDKAINCFDSAIKYIPYFSFVYTAKAAALFPQMKNTEALEMCDQAIHYDEKNVKAYIGKGYAYSNLHQYDKAIEFLTKATEIDSLDPQPIYFMGIANQNKGNKEKAKYYLEKANRMSGGQ